MPDPFEQLRDALLPAASDPIFAASLRDRLEAAFDLPKGVTVSDAVLEELSPATGTSSTTITPYLAVRDARAAVEWYREAFGARLIEEPIVMGDGTIGHAELDLDGARLMLSEERPGIGTVAPAPEGVPVTIHLEVRDVDVVIAGALAAGARLDRAAADYDYGRNGVIRDPFGHRWLIFGRPAVAGLRHGDIGYVSLWVPDVDRAAVFFSSVLGWEYAPAGSRASRQVTGLSFHHGMIGGIEPPTLFCCYAVEDLDAARQRVVAAGGSAGDVDSEPFGLVSTCVDDQGVDFALFQPPDGVTVEASRAPNGSRPGDLAYVTMEVVDADRTVAFYGAVLGWRAEAGSGPDRWQVANVVPMVGISGGHERATTLPLYRVSAIDDAVAAVHAGGGTATEPERQPYGTTSSCTDDQGTRLYVGELTS